MTENKNKLVYILGLIIIILVIIAGFGFKLYLDTKDNLKELQVGNLPGTPTTKEIKEMVAKVGRHMLLPSEDPVLITVANVDVLKKTQPFFERAKNGDKLLVYKDKVILYDPKADKIIDVAQIRPNSTQEATSSNQLSPNVKKYNLMILNGTSRSNLTQLVEPTISQFKEISITTKSFAKKRDYTQNILVDLKGANSTLTQTLSQSLKAEIRSLPPEENKPSGDTDFILILGEPIPTSTPTQ